MPSKFFLKIMGLFSRKSQFLLNKSWLSENPHTKVKTRQPARQFFSPTRGSKTRQICGNPHIMATLQNTTVPYGLVYVNKPMQIHQCCHNVRVPANRAGFRPCCREKISVCGLAGFDFGVRVFTSANFY